MLRTIFKFISSLALSFNELKIYNQQLWNSQVFAEWASKSCIYFAGLVGASVWEWGAAARLHPSGGQGEGWAEFSRHWCNEVPEWGKAMRNVMWWNSHVKASLLGVFHTFPAGYLKYVHWYHSIRYIRSEKKCSIYPSRLEHVSMVEFLTHLKE